MKLIHTITIKHHADNRTDTVEVYEDGASFKVNTPAGERKDRVIDVISLLAYALWEKDL